MPLLGEAWLEDGLRVYAIGDVHGQFGKLSVIHQQIDADLAARPVAAHRRVHVGDYVDRGPASREVMNFLCARAKDPNWIMLLGNHDRALIQTAQGDPEAWDGWLSYGGVATCLSYDVDPDLYFSDQRLFRTRLRAALPDDHVAFLTRDAYRWTSGDFLFVHAGVDPMRPLAQQTVDDLTWIRAPFLTWTEDFGAVVIHGHTPTDDIDLQPNRIGIDTGAAWDGPLTCLVIEGADVAALTADGPAPVSPTG